MILIPLDNVKPKKGLIVRLIRERNGVSRHVVKEVLSDTRVTTCDGLTWTWRQSAWYETTRAYVEIPLCPKEAL